MSASHAARRSTSTSSASSRYGLSTRHRSALRGIGEGTASLEGGVPCRAVPNDTPNVGTCLAGEMGIRAAATTPDLAHTPISGDRPRRAPCISQHGPSLADGNPIGSGRVPAHSATPNRYRSIAGLVRVLTPRQLLPFWMAIGLTFAAFGFLIDVTARGRSAPLTLALNVIFSGALAVAYAWMGMTGRRRL